MVAQHSTIGPEWLHVCSISGHVQPHQLEQNDAATAGRTTHANQLGVTFSINVFVFCCAKADAAARDIVNTHNADAVQFSLRVKVRAGERSFHVALVA